MAGLEIYKLIMEQSVRPVPEIDPLFIPLVLGSKPFEISSLETPIKRFVSLVELMDRFPRDACRLPFRKIWLECKSDTWFECVDPDQEGSRHAFIIEDIGEVRFKCHAIVWSYDDNLRLRGPFYVPELVDDKVSDSTFTIFGAIFLINSSHIETFGRRISPTLERKVKRSGARLPFLTWSEVKLKPGETVTVPAITTLGNGGWKMPWHEVRGHWHWYRTKYGVQRGWADSTGRWYDKPGFWVLNWLDQYERGDQDVGIKRTRYRMVSP